MSWPQSSSSGTSPASSARLSAAYLLGLLGLLCLVGLLCLLVTALLLSAGARSL
jgi:hypothetical protein